MREQILLSYASSLTRLCEINSSFDSGVIKIAYPDQNRNKSFIAKEDFDRCAPTMFNVPLVCHYIRETDSLGGHDVELVKDTDGQVKLVNVTEPVGVVPESAKYWWETITEEDGSVHDYLCADVLLWKRQEAYDKIKNEGSSLSMEITVNKGEKIDGIYHIYDFEFTAFTLIGVEPCFESAGLQTFSTEDREQFFSKLSEMMHELSEGFTKQADTSSEVGNIHPHSISTEGGEKALDENKELFTNSEQQTEEVAEETFTENDEPQSENVEEETSEEAVEFEAVEENKEESEETSEEVSEEVSEDNFALLNNVIDSLKKSIAMHTEVNRWGEESPRYWYDNCDLDLKEVYCLDSRDWYLYGFKFTMDGDNAVIDFENGKRKKYVIADYDEGQNFNLADIFNAIVDVAVDKHNLQAQYKADLDVANQELETLRKFKKDTEDAIEEAQRRDLFAQFNDLDGVESFENLRAKASEYDLETLEEKCYAIRGKQNSKVKFSLENKVPKIRVERKETTEEPYGGLFVKYGFEAKD